MYHLFSFKLSMQLMMRDQVLGRDKSMIDPDLDKNTTEMQIDLDPGKIMAGMLTIETNMEEVSIGKIGVIN